jgi:hypothetical protein
MALIQLAVRGVKAVRLGPQEEKAALLDLKREKQVPPRAEPTGLTPPRRAGC